MKTNNRSLRTRLLVPIVLTIIITSLVLLFAVYRISVDVIEDYHRSMVEVHSRETAEILATALAELTTAQLLDNPVVVDVKKKTVMETLESHWNQEGINGMVIENGGKQVLSTLPLKSRRRYLNSRRPPILRSTREGPTCAASLLRSQHGTGASSRSSGPARY